MSPDLPVRHLEDVDRVARRLERFSGARDGAPRSSTSRCRVARRREPRASRGARVLRGLRGQRAGLDHDVHAPVAVRVPPRRARRQGGL